MKNMEVLNTPTGESCVVNEYVIAPEANTNTNRGFLGKRILKRIGAARIGSIEVTLPNGQTVKHVGSKSGHSAAVVFKTWKSLFQYVTQGQLAFVEGFMRGDVNVPHLPSLMYWFLDNEPYFPKKINSRFRDFANRFSHLILNDNNRSGSRKNISFHYDLGNEFYEKWLDKTMTYSAGLFKDTNDLETSQKIKYQRIIDQLDLRDGESLLEIGCGWGGFAEQALSQKNIDYRGVTISREQLDYANLRLEKFDKKNKPAVFEDYRDTEGTFDKVVSIEMFEAVGEKHWDTYFETLKKRLKPGGKAVIQVITIDHDRFLTYRNRVDFIQKYIFPGGMLPSKQEFSRHAKSAGFKIDNEFAFGEGYAKTLQIWKKNFLASWPEIWEHGFDKRFYRMWLYYLDYCAIAFERGTIDVMHYTLSHD